MIRKIKIIFVLPSLTGGGAQRVILNILKGINKSKFEVELVVFNKSGALIEFVPKNIKIISFNKKRLRECIFLLINYINKSKPKIIFSTLGHVNLFLIAIRFFLSKDVKIIIREANTLSATIKLYIFPKLVKFLYQILYKKSDMVIALSKSMYNDLKNDFGVQSKNLCIMYNPVDLKFIRNKIHSLKKLKENKKYFISSGRLVFQKGFDRLIRIFSKLPKNNHLIIMGEGPELNNLKKITYENNLHTKISFIGFQKNPWKWYASAKAILITSRWEGMPNSVLEALACGCKVISVNGIDGLKDIQRFTKKGSVFIENFPNNFLKKINLVRKKKKKSNKILKKSLLPKNFDLTYSIQKYEKLFINVAKNDIKI